jgi:type I restriction enzyme S subunit
MSKRGHSPESWEYVSLGDVCVFKGGSGFKESFQGKDDGDYPFIKVSDLNLRGNEKYVVNSNNWVSAFELKELKAALQPIGATVFAKVGAALKLNRRRLLVRPTAIDNNMMAAIPDEKHLDREYLYYFLLGEDLGRFSQESAVPSINQGHLESIKIPLPPLAEQRKIAEILRTWDEAIETAEAEISRLKERLVSLIAKLTLRQCVGKPEQGWHDVKIGDLLEEVDRDVEWDDAKTFSLISCGRRASGIFLRERKSGSDIDVKKMYEVQAGDFIVSQKQSAHAGWGMVTKEFHGHHVSPMYTIYGLKGKDLHMPYFNWLCKTPWMRHQAYLSSYGVHIEKMSFVSRLFLKTKIRIPTLLADQEKVCIVLEGAENEIKAATLKLAKLNDQKRGLMQKLLTGEVRVIA